MDDIYLHLGDLDSQIYLLRNELTFDNPFSEEYKNKVIEYNKLCEERRMIEESIDNDK